VDTVFECGWATLHNGELLDVAEQEGYELLITTDQNLRHQQDLTDRQLAIIVLLSTSWPRIQLRIDTIQAAVESVAECDHVSPSQYASRPREWRVAKYSLPI
jgi:hypothetical protein